MTGPANRIDMVIGDWNIVHSSLSGPVELKSHSIGNCNGISHHFLSSCIVGRCGQTIANNLNVKWDLSNCK